MIRGCTFLRFISASLCHTQGGEEGLREERGFPKYYIVLSLQSIWVTGCIMCYTCCLLENCVARVSHAVW
jgi:hypothetical protein